MTNDNQILDAARWATEMHAGQLRKHNGAPYIRHPQRVAARTMCLEWVSVQGICAAWLHDVPEEVGGTDKVKVKEVLDEISIRFGSLTRDFVLSLTPVTKGMKGPRGLRKALERSFLKRAKPMAKRIKMLDRIDNLQESLLDMQRGLTTDYKFNALYVTESRLLLDESLRGVDKQLEEELMDTIEFVGKWILEKTK